MNAIDRVQTPNQQTPESCGWLSNHIRYRIVFLPNLFVFLFFVCWLSAPRFQNAPCNTFFLPEHAMAGSCKDQNENHKPASFNGLLVATKTSGQNH